MAHPAYALKTKAEFSRNWEQKEAKIQRRYYNSRSCRWILSAPQGSPCFAGANRQAYMVLACAFPPDPSCHAPRTGEYSSLVWDHVCTGSIGMEGRQSVTGIGCFHDRKNMGSLPLFISSELVFNVAGNWYSTLLTAWADPEHGNCKVIWVDNWHFHHGQTKVISPCNRLAWVEPRYVTQSRSYHS
jgi:hypothetical protein